MSKRKHRKNPLFWEWYSTTTKSGKEDRVYPFVLTPGQKRLLGPSKGKHKTATGESVKRRVPVFKKGWFKTVRDTQEVGDDHLVVVGADWNRYARKVRLLEASRRRLRAAIRALGDSWWDVDTLRADSAALYKGRKGLANPARTSQARKGRKGGER